MNHENRTIKTKPGGICCLLFILGVLPGTAVSAQTPPEKPVLAVLPFTGGTDADGKSIGDLFSFQQDILNAFTVVNRDAVKTALTAYPGSRMGMTDAGALAQVGKDLNADYLIDGHLQKIGGRNLLCTSIISVKTFRLIAGDYREYKTIAEIPDLLPLIAEKLIPPTKLNPVLAPGLGVLPFEIQADVTAQTADTLTRILAIDIANTGRYTVLPRMTAPQPAPEEPPPPDGPTTVQDSQQTPQSPAEAAQTQAETPPAPEQTPYVLTGKSRRFGSRGILTASIHNRETAAQTAGAFRYYRGLADGIPLMAELAAVLTGLDQDADAYEPDDPHSSIEVLPGDAPIARTLHTGDADWFTVYAETGAPMVFETAGFVDTAIELYDADSLALLTYASDGGAGTNARMVYPVETGNTYLIKVRGGGAADTGLYQFGAAYQSSALPEPPPLPAVRADAYEPDRLDKPVQIPINAPRIARTLHAEDDADWFAVSAGPEGSVLVLDTIGSTDTYLELYAQSGECLQYNDDGGTGTNARIIYQAEPDAGYIVKVQSSAGAVGAYRFGAVRLPIPAKDASEPDGPNAPVKADLGAWLTRTLHENDEDWFTVTAGTAGGVLVFETQGYMDTSIELYAQADKTTPLAVNDDGGTDANGRIEYFALPETVYILKVRSYNGAVGTYQFGARPQEPVDIGGPLITRTLHEGDAHWFTIQPDSADLLTLETSGPADTVIELFNPDTNEVLQSGGNSGGNTNAPIDYLPEPGKRYTVKITGAQNPDTDAAATGAYQFRAGWGVAKDALEPDSQTAPVRVAVGDPWISRTIHKQDEDWFIVTAGTIGGVLVFELQREMRGYIELYDVQASGYLKFDWNRIEYFVKPHASYIVKVCGYGDEDNTGSYQFRITRQEPIAIGVSDGYYLGENEPRWFTVYSETDMPVIFETRGPTDTYMKIMNPDTHEILMSDNNSGIGVNPRIEYPVQGGKRYVIEISGYQDPDTGYYPSGSYRFGGVRK